MSRLSSRCLFEQPKEPTKESEGALRESPICDSLLAFRFAVDVLL